MDCHADVLTAVVVFNLMSIIWILVVSCVVFFFF